ncbi:hypothetical protein JA1_002577 [Spathaspora sp. JA1]|nr:hypothetical protein JA1_002577 [Spathaspora sp. JA1]
MTTRTKRRSRNGCLSCKRLKIKCDEAKPSCEYCAHTNRECIYPIPGIRGSQLSPTREASRSTSPISVSPEAIEIVNPSQDLPLIQTTSLLNVTPFELRLLNYFDHRCIDFFSFGVHSKVHNTWKLKVPQLFTSSDLVKQSIYSFSGMSLLTEMELAGNVDGTAMAPLYDIKSRLFEKTLTYFMNTLYQSRTWLTEMRTENEEKMKEMVISSFLMFAFLGVHPYKLLPVISFDKSQTDLVSISRGIREIIKVSTPIILKSNLRELFIIKDLPALPSMDSTSYPIIDQLLQDLTKAELPYDERTTIQKAIQDLHDAMYAMMHFKYPIPFFRWIIILPDPYRDLLYQKHEFSIRLLYVFSSLCLIYHFHMLKESNMWLDYMQWFKKYSDVRYGGFVYDLDKWLYELGVVKQFTISKYNDVGYFDPQAEYEKEVDITSDFNLFLPD